jgi:hypothetical protein
VQATGEDKASLAATSEAALENQKRWFLDTAEPVIDETMKIPRQGIIGAIATLPEI